MALQNKTTFIQLSTEDKERVCEIQEAEPIQHDIALKEPLHFNHKAIFGPSLARVELTTAVFCDANKQTHRAMVKSNVSLAYCVIWHSGEPKNKKKKPRQKGAYQAYLQEIPGYDYAW